MLDTTYNQKKAEDFAESLVDILNKSSIALAISLGHRTGLFDAMEKLSYATSEQIAEAADLNERCVREWLGALTAGRVIDYNPETRTYKLPEEHAAFLTRRAAPNNLAAVMQYIPLLGSVEDKIVECFRGEAGDASGADFSLLHKLKAEAGGQLQMPAGLVSILSLVYGLEEKLPAQTDPLDLSRANRKALNLAAEGFQSSRTTDYDFSEETLAGVHKPKWKDWI